MATNIQRARAMARANTIDHDEFDRLPMKPDGWVAEDSDFPRRYWRVGGNAVVYQYPQGLEVMRWHDFLKEAARLKIHIQYWREEGRKVRY